MKKKYLLLIIISFSIFESLNAQTYFKFDENGLMANTDAFGAFLCPLGKDKADEVLKSVIGLDVPQKHINGYCEVRADYICRKISPIIFGPGCEVGKIWVFAPSIYSLISKDKLSTKDPLFDNEVINWDYHVAPILSVKNGTKIDTVVIDFSIQDKAFINYKDWLKKFNCKKAIYTLTDDNYFLFYTLEGLTLTGTGYNGYTTPSNLPKIITGHFWRLNDSDRKTIPSGLAYNDLAVHLVEKYYNDSKYEKYKGAIKLATKVEGLKKINNGTLNQLPPELISECQKFYVNRLDYWTKQLK